MTNLLVIVGLYLLVDTIILMRFWIKKELLIGHHILWFPMPFTGILFYEKYAKMIEEIEAMEKIK